MAKFQEYPLLALRGRVVFPDTTVNFDIGRMISLTAVKYASERDSRIFVCAQKEAEKEEITTTDVYLTGTVVKLRQKSVVAKAGYDAVSVSSEPYEKKGLFGRFGR